jgi:hypothetical protein
LKRFIAFKTLILTLEKSEAIAKITGKVLNDGNSRLSNELKDAIKWMNDYIKTIYTGRDWLKFYGLLSPSVCKTVNAGIDKSGKFSTKDIVSEHTGNVVKGKVN